MHVWFLPSYAADRTGNWHVQLLWLSRKQILISNYILYLVVDKFGPTPCPFHILQSLIQQNFRHIARQVKCAAWFSSCKGSGNKDVMRRFDEPWLRTIKMLKALFICQDQKYCDDQSFLFALDNLSQLTILWSMPNSVIKDYSIPVPYPTTIRSYLYFVLTKQYWAIDPITILSFSLLLCCF